jgi:UDPglucose 6-dehydrogenase
MTSNISIIGLGKLGASMAAAFAHKGFSVIGVDVNKHSVDRMNDGRAPVQETDLDDLIAGNRERIRATLSHEDAVLGSDVSFVIVPTPSDEKGSFSLQYAEWAFAQIGKAMRKKQSYHLVVLTSTVLPGATRHGLLPILERESGKKAGRDFGLCYSPEFIALGSIIRNFLNPDFTLIGEIDERSGSMLESIYERLVDNVAPSARMSLENAELTKISVNTYVTTKITFANMLASICERLPGGDVDVVTSALGLDTRIGKKYLAGAIGYGGPCFPRDNVALSYIAGELGVSSQLAETTDFLNRSMGERIAEEIVQEVPSGSTIAVLGLAYKPFSHVTEESQGVQIAEHLSRRGIRVVAFDPMSADMAVPEHGWSFLVLDSLEDCLQQAQSIVITTPDPVFAALTEDQFANQWATVKVFDLWRILREALQTSRRIDYRGAGLGRDNSDASQRLKDLWNGGDTAVAVRGNES